MNKHSQRRSFTLSLILFFLQYYPATGLADNKPVDAAKLYHDFCSVCHGDNGDGESRAKQGLIPPPRDFTTPGLATSLSRETMIDVVNNGRQGTAMAGWKTRLDHQQVSAIVDYIRQNFMHTSNSSKKILEKTPLTRAARIYAQACSVCHGDKGNGAVWASSTLNPPPRDFTQTHISRERIISAMTHGRQGTAMPSFKSQYSAAEIAEVADYILANFVPVENKQATSQVSTAQPVSQSEFFQQSYPGNLQADIRSGEALYRFNCSTCHGNSGEGNGPRAYFIFPRPRNFLSESSRGTFNRPALYKAVHDGVLRREMPAWRHVLSSQEIANVSEYVFQTFILTSPAGK